LLRAGYPGLLKPGEKRIADMLCGQVAVVFGDPEFMAALSLNRWWRSAGN
jgi:hypothetical protein